MTGLPFDPQHPPEHPPPEVRRPLLWRMGWRLATDHQPPPVSAGLGAPVCRCCGHRWPCEPHLLGGRGLVASLADPPPQEGAGHRLEIRPVSGPAGPPVIWAQVEDDGRWHIRHRDGRHVAVGWRAEAVERVIAMTAELDQANDVATGTGDGPGAVE